MLALILALVIGAQSVAVTGTVVDSGGGVLPHASVDLIAPAGAVVSSTTTDQAGRFRFENVAAGAYQVRAAFEGLRTASQSVRVGTRSPGAVKLVLSPPGVQEHLTVGTEAGLVTTSPGDNLSAVTVDQQMLEGLPVLDQDIVGTLSRFLDSGALGGGGPTIVVNGMEVSALRVSASAVQQIKINQNPYSAEYNRPGRGRIEILTKPGEQHYSGEFNLVGRDASLDARNAFATTKPTEQKRIFEGVFGGPLGTDGKTSFMMSANHQVDDQQAIIVAADQTGPLHGLAAQPNTQALVSLAITQSVSDHTLISITPAYEYEAADNRGVGGTTLASAGSNFRHHEESVRYNHQTLFGAHLINQFQILVGHEREPTTSASSDRGIVVADAFTGGGAQADLLRTETHMQMSETLTWSAGAHSVQMGFQVPDWSRRGFVDRTNSGGTYYFSGLDTYQAGRPYAFVQQRGNGSLAFLEKQLGAYVQDNWQVRGNLSISLGLRYDWQNYFHDDNNVSPRGSFAWAPRGSKTTVIRGGAGLFTDRSGPVIIADLLHSQRGDLVRYVVDNPSYPDPSASIGAATPPSITQLAPGVQIPRTIQYGASVERQISKTLTLSADYTAAHGYDLFRSVDVNAPPPPLYLARPNPAFGVIRQIESNGRQITRALTLTLRGKISHWFNGQTQYAYSRAWNDTNGLNSYPANDYNLASEWGRADFERRHRLALLGQVTPGHVADIGLALTMNSAGPYTELLGTDVYDNGRGRARPAGVARNTLTGAGYAQLDLRVSRAIVKPHGGEGRSLTVALDAFNVLNRVNYATFAGTIGSPFFGQPISARPPRQLQVSVRLSY